MAGRAKKAEARRDTTHAPRGYDHGSRRRNTATTGHVAKAPRSSSSCATQPTVAYPLPPHAANRTCSKYFRNESSVVSKEVPPMKSLRLFAIPPPPPPPSPPDPPCCCCCRCCCCCCCDAEGADARPWSPLDAGRSGGFVLAAINLSFHEGIGCGAWGAGPFAVAPASGLLVSIMYKL